jgi:hypothetical protein
MRERAEDERDIRERCAFGGAEFDGVASNTGARAALLIRRGERQLEFRVVEDECTELAAGIAARAEHSNGYSIHQECIIMRKATVNADAAAAIGSRPSVLSYAPCNRQPASASQSATKPSCG